LNANFLRSKGYEVTEASDGEAAWSLALRGNYDLLLLDVMMPGMSGWEVCKRVKQTPATAGTAVVMLTGMGETLNDMNSPLFAADAWLDKPFDFGELERKLKETLAKFGKNASMISDDTEDDDRPTKRGAKSKASAKKPAAKKPAAKKPAAKTPAKKVAAKKPAAKKPAAPKAKAAPPAKKAAPAKKPVAKKKPAKKR